MFRKRTPRRLHDDLPSLDRSTSRSSSNLALTGSELARLMTYGTRVVRAGVPGTEGTVVKGLWGNGMVNVKWERDEGVYSYRMGCEGVFELDLADSEYEKKVKKIEEERKMDKTKELLGNTDTLQNQLEEQKELLERIVARAEECLREMDELKQRPGFMSEIAVEKAQSSVEEQKRRIKSNEEKMKAAKKKIAQSELKLKEKRAELQAVAKKSSVGEEKRKRALEMLAEAESEIAKSKLEMEDIEVDIFDEMEIQDTEKKKRHEEEVKKANNEKYLSKIQKEIEENQAVLKEMEEIKLKDGYQEERKINALREDIRKLDEKIRGLSGGSPAVTPSPSTANFEWQDELACAVCLEIPAVHVFTCQQDHVMCEACNQALKVKGPYQCPQCKEDLTKVPLRRNMALERIIRRMGSQTGKEAGQLV